MSNFDTESMVIGGLLLDPSQLADVRMQLEPHQFASVDFSELYRAMVRLDDLDSPVDVFTLSKEVEKPEYKTRLMMHEIGEILENTPSAANLAAYVELMVSSFITRKVLQVGDEVFNASKQTKGVELLDLAQAKLSALSTTAQDDTCVHVNTALSNMLENLEQQASGKIQYQSTGLSDIDFYLKGLVGTRLYVIGARPAMGKTALMLTMAMRLIRDKVPTIIFSLEMPTDEITRRLICIASGMRSDAYDDMREDDWAKLTGAFNVLKDKNLSIDDRAGFGISYLKNKIRQFRRKNGKCAVFIDYLQLMAVKENRVQGIGEITRELKNLAKEIDSPIVILSQLSRALEQRPNKRPVMSDLRESGEIEQDADAILFLYRDEVYNEDSQDKGIAEIIVGKNRHGKTGTARVCSRLESYRFDDLARF